MLGILDFCVFVVVGATVLAAGGVAARRRRARGAPGAARAARQ